MSSLPLAMGNALISCIHAAHTKYESNPLDWQRVVEIGWRLLTRQDMERFQEVCKDGLLVLANANTTKSLRHHYGLVVSAYANKSAVPRVHR
jgi:hypothetical protein